ncbi:MAG: hypothetical protein AUJ37_01885 [Candidatus Magasanikbacteria bacterium CG1_02_41_34]|nr:MAG: hypothetical protein AUJ37_01885 [Candidatus Magasanikbacteria bacterium CG1_02_41_34]
MKKKLLLIVVGILLFGGFLFYRNIYTAIGIETDTKVISIPSGLSVREIAVLLEEQGIVPSSNILVRYLVWKNMDTKIQHGDITFVPPHSIAHVAMELANPQGRKEREITLLPGWDIRQIAEYFEKEGIASAEDFYRAVGTPLNERPSTYDMSDVPQFDSKSKDANLEGYLRPDTYRIFESASVDDIVGKLVHGRADQFTDQMLADTNVQGKTVHEILTMASILEREVRTPEDRRLVSDLFWRRYNIGMALQADSTVHYITGTEGSVFTTKNAREVDSLWNTYKYPGLPPGPISNPSVGAIMAAIYPEKNTNWYFLTTLDTGEVKYAKTLDQQNANSATYLR